MSIGMIAFNVWFFCRHLAKRLGGCPTSLFTAWGEFDLLCSMVSLVFECLAANASAHICGKSEAVLQIIHMLGCNVWRVLVLQSPVCVDGFVLHFIWNALLIYSVHDCVKCAHAPSMLHRTQLHIEIVSTALVGENIISVFGQILAHLSIEHKIMYTHACRSIVVPSLFLNSCCTWLPLRLPLTSQDNAIRSTDMFGSFVIVWHNSICFFKASTILKPEKFSFAYSNSVSAVRIRSVCVCERESVSGTTSAIQSTTGTRATHPP